MATWMAHLRVADKLLDHLDNIDQTAFIMGNIAPDSGVPTENGYVPDKNTSHFKITGEDGHNTYGWRIFAEQYLTPEKIKNMIKSSTRSISVILPICLPMFSG